MYTLSNLILPFVLAVLYLQPIFLFAHALYAERIGSLGLVNWSIGTSGWVTDQECKLILAFLVHPQIISYKVTVGCPEMR
jgi:hypothetical protein